MSIPLKVSEHYLGTEGETYAQQRLIGRDKFTDAVNLSFFKPYLRSSDVVLDFGCGSGAMLHLLQGLVARADGLEVNPAVAVVARASGASVFESIDALPDEPTYDAIVSNHVLEHVRDVCTTLESLRRRLKPGGLFITKLPLEDFRERRQLSWSANDADHHLQTWTPRLFANTLFESGYDVRECRVITSAWHPRLLPVVKVGLGPLAFWALAVLKKRRQLLAVGVQRA